MESWTLALTAERKSPATIRLYTDGARAFLRWRESTKPSGGFVPDKSTAQAWVADLLGNGAEPATAHARLKALRRFTAWLAEEGEVKVDPLAGIGQVRVDTKVTRALSDDELKALLATCRGRSLRDCRDTALIRFMTETGARSAETVGLQVDDIDLKLGLAVIRRGKGGRGRVVPISPQTVAAVDRYLRARKSHRLHELPALWLGQGGKTFGYQGLALALKSRAEQAGISGFHLRLLRHTFATRWLAKGGTEGGLMSVAGWSSREMMSRYTSASASERAADEARRLNLGDL